MQGAGAMRNEGAGNKQSSEGARVSGTEAPPSSLGLRTSSRKAGRLPQ